MLMELSTFGLSNSIFFSFYLLNYIISSRWFCLLTYKTKTILLGFFFVSYLCFWQVEMLSKLFAFSSNNILVLFKGLFQFQQLTRAKSCANSLWFAERKQKFGQMRTWKEKYWYAISKVSPNNFSKFCVVWYKLSFFCITESSDC